MTASCNRPHMSSTSTRALRVLGGLVCAVVFASLGCRAQNGSESPGGTVSASFSQDRTAGLTGLSVQFTDMSAGEVESYLWDFGNGQTSTQANPMASYPDAGVYDVSLTVTGASGASTMVAESLIIVDDLPTAGISCFADTGIAPFTTTCASTAVNADTLEWTFANGASVFVSNEASPTVTLDQPGTYSVTQVATNAVGTDTATTSIDVVVFAVTVTPVAGPGPGDARLLADTSGLNGILETWFVDGLFVGGGKDLVVPFRTPGTYSIQFSFGSVSPTLVADLVVEYVVPFGPPTAAFAPDALEGPGPLDIVFADESTGDVTSWAWDFGDGTSCVFPAPDGVPANDPSVCNSSSPSHTYQAIGLYDVELTVTGPAQDPADPDLSDSVRLSDSGSSMIVTILDPSFEAQGVAAEIAGAWAPIRPASATAVADHVALSSTEALGADAGMPSDGNKWAALDGLGTDGLDPVSDVENGIRQDMVRPSTATVLEFDYALLVSEPTGGVALDAMTATVTDGVSTVEVTSAIATSRSPYAGPSTRYPTLDGSPTRVTPVHTASLDLATAFPGAAADTVYTLTIRVANDMNGFRSPRAYVDHIRFVEPAAPLAASFSVPMTIVAGDVVDFMDETCLDPGGTGCEVPTSWRWDFDIPTNIAAPASTGSNEQNPSYTFDVAGDYDVTLLARNADQESLSTMSITVLEAPVATPVLLTTGTLTTSTPITFEDQSTSGVGDEITEWSWDFAGFATADYSNPSFGGPNPPPPATVGPITISQPGTWMIRLTVTTESEQVDMGEVEIVVEP